MSEIPFGFWYVLVNAIVMMFCLRQYLLMANKGRELQRLDMDLGLYPGEARHWLRLVVLSLVFGPFLLMIGILFLIKETFELAKRDLFDCLLWSQAHPPDPMNQEDFLT